MRLALDGRLLSTDQRKRSEHQRVHTQTGPIGCQRTPPALQLTAAHRSTAATAESCEARARRIAPPAQVGEKLQRLRCQRRRDPQGHDSEAPSPSTFTPARSQTDATSAANRAAPPALAPTLNHAIPNPLMRIKIGLQRFAGNLCAALKVRTTLRRTQAQPAGHVSGQESAQPISFERRRGPLEQLQPWSHAAQCSRRN